MGYWRITVDGCGCHHNAKRAIDADLATQDFVAELKAQGHTITAATFDMRNALVGGDVVESPQNIDFLTS